MTMPTCTDIPIFTLYGYTYFAHYYLPISMTIQTKHQDMNTILAIINLGRLEISEKPKEIV